MCGAALCASVTHAISISVIVFELTGQITYVLPILTSVLVSNALSRHLQPSMYDSLIKVKKITVLPKMRLSNIPGGEWLRSAQRRGNVVEQISVVGLWLEDRYCLRELDEKRTWCVVERYVEVMLRSCLN